MPTLSRRSALRLGVGAAGATALAAFATPSRAHAAPTLITGSFVSAARGGITTNFAIARPPGQTAALRPVIALHGKGSDAAAVMAGGAMPDVKSILLALLYSCGAHGIMTLNDFKSVEGDRQMGIGSLPVRLGIDGAAKAACLIMAVPQAIVIFLLIGWGHPAHAVSVLGLVFIQLLLMDRFLESPSARAIWYSGLGINFFVTGMMVSAFALRSAYTVPA